MASPNPTSNPNPTPNQACDGWYYGEDPTKEKKVLTGEVTEDKMAALRAEGEALVARRAAVQAAQEAARGAATDSA